MSRSINKAIIVGNLTRDPEMRYTPSGQSVTSFGVATNRKWTTDGQQKEDTEFHNVVAWGKLAEICSNILKKGRHVYVEGRLQTRQWEGKDGVRRNRTEIVATDMIVLDSRGASGAGDDYAVSDDNQQEPPPDDSASEDEPVKKTSTKKGKESKSEGNEDISVDEIPF